MPTNTEVFLPRLPPFCLVGLLRESYEWMSVPNSILHSTRGAMYAIIAGNRDHLRNFLLSQIVCNHTTQNIIRSRLAPFAHWGPSSPATVMKARKSFAPESASVASGHSRHSDYSERSRHWFHPSPGTRRWPG